jgi:hypothetical protein
LEIEVDPEVTKPGKPVAATLRVADSAGTDRVASVGLTVIDEAVEALLEDLGDPMAIASFARQSEATLFQWEENFAGIRRRDLTGYDPRNLPEGLETVARYLLSWGDTWRMVLSSDGIDLLNDLYLPQMQRALAGLVERCDQGVGAPCPETEGDLEGLVAARLGVDAVDPWGSSYRVELRTIGAKHLAKISSNGPDQCSRTPDDLVPYLRSWRWFAPTGDPLSRALKRVYPKTGTWPTTSDDVLQTAGEAGIVWSALRDPWGHPVEVETSFAGHRLSISVVSPGPDGVLSIDRRGESDDVLAWMVVLDTFEPSKRWIVDALAITHAMGGATPETPRQLREILSRSSLPEGALIDLHGNPYKLEAVVVPVYSDQYRHGTDTFEVEPILEGQLIVTVTSGGPDGLHDTPDDVFVARLEGAKQQVKQPEEEKNPEQAGTFPLNELFGAISGVVFADGLPLPGVTVEATDERGESAGVAIANGAGRFTLVLAPGEYTVTASLVGFRRVVQGPLTVEGSKIAVCDFELEPEGFAGEIMVSASIPEVQTISVNTASTIDEDALGTTNEAASAGPRPFSTPRVRRDFPETLYWDPDLVVDGSARIEFDLADATTTWRLQAVASTIDGGFATAQGEVIATLPFYVQLERPQTLTVGDRIDLPGIARNFTDDDQRIHLRLKAGSGLEIRRERATLKIGARKSSRAEFEVRADAPAETVTVQLEAVGEDTGDAVEHTIEIRPFAEKRSAIAAAFVHDQKRLEIEIPDHIVPGTVQSRLRVLPSLASQIAESIRGLLTRPNGCAEQITSTAFVHLMHLELTGDSPANADSTSESARAVEQATALLERLIKPEGGVSFWSRGRPNVALTAYVLRFLVALDEPESTVLARRLAVWLIGKQREDGGWSTERSNDSGVDVQLTAFVTRALAEAGASGAIPDDETEALDRALNLLELRVGRFAEPHALSSFVLACVQDGRPATARRAAERLAAESKVEGPGCYWHIGANTPLDGWGLPGRIETTALAVQALAAVDRHAFADRIDCGTRFLTTNKDPFSSWYSTQTTVSVLEAYAAAGLGSGEPGGTLVVKHDGLEIETLVIPTDAQAMIPVAVDLGGLSDSSQISVELVREGGDAALGAELITTYFVPWGDTESGHPNLAFEVDFDNTDLEVGEKTSCRVRASRVAHRGYGMLLAEVGLPPGAVVDRPALERQLGDRFEIRPDRVVLYLMPLAGGTEIEIPFTPRFSGEFVSTASLLYDYYNPLARVVSEPVRFTIEPDPDR